MEKEISSGTMLGIVLIALAAVIGLGFGVFSIAKGVANQGVVDVQDNLSTVSESAFTDFDQKIVTGTQVISAYKTFQGKPVAILINTQSMRKGVAFHPDHVVIKAHTFAINGDISVATAIEESTKYVNYNALFNYAGESMKLKGGVYEFSGPFAVDAYGKVSIDTQITGFSKAGNSEYISTGSRFDANLIKDMSGNTVGVMFTQQQR